MLPPILEREVIITEGMDISYNYPLKVWVKPSLNFEVGRKISEMFEPARDVRLRVNRDIWNNLRRYLPK